MRSCSAFSENPFCKKLIFRFFLKSAVILIFGIGFAVYAQTPEREKPRLIDFGASLRPNYNKPKANKSGSAEDDDVISVETALVGSDVLVVDEKGFAMSNLSKDDFLITEDGTPQKIEFFELGKQPNVPRSIVLIIDYSPSLQPYLEKSIAAAKVLIDKLNPLDKMAIVTDDVELITDFTRDKKTLKEKLDALEFKAQSKKAGRSLQYSALYAALNELFDVEDVRRPIVIFQTDGDEYPFLKDSLGQLSPELARYYGGKTDYAARTTKFGYQDVIAATEKVGTTVYTIIPSLHFLGLSPEDAVTQGRIHYLSGQKEYLTRTTNRPLPESNIKEVANLYAKFFPVAHESIVSVANASGGWGKYLETPDEADAIYSSVLDDINNRYLLGFYPTNQTRDGKRRTIKVEIRNHPEYKILTRRSYYAPEN